MTKRYTEHLRQMNTSHVDSEETEKMIKHAVYQCEKSMRENVIGMVIGKLTKDHEKKLK